MRYRPCNNSQAKRNKETLCGRDSVNDQNSFKSIQRQFLFTFFILKMTIILRIYSLKYCLFLLSFLVPRIKDASL